MTDPTPLNAAELAAVRARSEAATPGPWTTVCGWVGSALRKFLSLPGVGDGIRDFHLLSDESIEFIAHARTDIPRLLKTIEAQGSRVAELEQDRDKERAVRITAERESQHHASRTSELYIERDELRERIAHLEAQLAGAREALLLMATVADLHGAQGEQFFNARNEALDFLAALTPEAPKAMEPHGDYCSSLMGDGCDCKRQHCPECRANISPCPSHREPPV